MVYPASGEPFGPRIVFGLRGVAVEVLESGVVASISLFDLGRVREKKAREGDTS